MPHPQPAPPLPHHSTGPDQQAGTYSGGTSCASSNWRRGCRAQNRGSVKILSTTPLHDTLTSRDTPPNFFWKDLRVETWRQMRSILTIEGGVAPYLIRVQEVGQDSCWPWISHRPLPLEQLLPSVRNNQQITM